jgi:hypothetical protein
MSGEDEIRKTLAEAQPAEDVDDCPVVALGQWEGSYFFFALSRQIREMTVKDMTDTGLVSLFNGDPSWLLAHYGKRDKDGKPTGDIAAKAAAYAMMRRCAAVGLYRRDTPKVLWTFRTIGSRMRQIDSGQMEAIPIAFAS